MVQYQESGSRYCPTGYPRCRERHRRVCQRSQHIGGDAFADGEIHHPDGAAVHGIAEQQHFKLRDLAVAVHAALGQRLRGKGFNIDG